MTRFNKKQISSNTFKSTTKENVAGGEAFSVSKEFEIVSFLATTFVKDTYYQSKDEAVNKLEEMYKNYNDKEFFAKAAVYVRNEYGMRSVTHLVASLTAKYVKGEKWTKYFYKAVFHRPDDITETMAIYMGKYGKPIPNSLKKGIRLAMEKFNDYHISKYKAEDKAIKMIDVVNLTHPVPTKDNTKSLMELVKNTLKNTETWEALLSEAGKQEDKVTAKADVWKKLLMENKLGYFALLRNLNNINKQAPGLLDIALRQLVDREKIKNSLVLPFRFLTAHKRLESVEGTSKILKALSQAADISLDNVPTLEGKTVIFLDRSGSMRGQPIDIASLFAAVLCKKMNCVIYEFGDRCYELNYDSNDSILTLAKQFNSSTCGGTDFKIPFRTIKDKGLKFDRIIMLSDMQGWMGYDSPLNIFQEYCEELNVKPIVYSWDLAGHGTTQLPSEKIYCLSGWSDKVFNSMKFIESDKQIMINIIKSISFN